jgi:hypothetical protein
LVLIAAAVGVALSWPPPQPGQRFVDAPATTVAPAPTSTPVRTGADGAPAPAYSDWPDARSTGVPAGVVLRRVDGNLQLDRAGMVVDGIDLHGCIILVADNVTIRNSRIQGSCAEGTIGPRYDAHPRHTLIENVEVDGLNLSTSFSLISGEDFTCLRCKLHGGGTGIRAGDNVTVQDSYLYGNHVGGESHNTAMSIHGGNNITIRHNYLECDGGNNCSAALSLYTHDGPIDGVLVEENLFSGGGYCVYAGVYKLTDGSLLAATHVRFYNNGFLTNQWPRCGDLGPVGAWDGPATGNAWAGNYWYPDRSRSVDP